MRGLAALVLTIALVVSGCGGEDDPQPAPSPTKSPSPSETTPTPPEMPEAASPRSKAGAVAFVKHYVDLLNHATFTGDTGPAKALQTNKCTSCDRMIGSIEEIYSNGGAVKGGAWRPRIVSEARHPNGKGWTVDAKISYGPQSVVRSEGAPPEEFSGGGRLVSFILIRTEDGWAVDQWTRAS